METREERAVEHGDSSWPAKCLERVRSCYAGEEAARHGRLLDDAEDDGRKLLTEEQRARAKAVSSTFATQLRRLNSEGEESEARARCIIVETDSWKWIWDSVITFLILYSAVEVPIRLSFSIEAEGSQFAFDTMVSLCFLADLVIAFNTAYLENGCMPTRIKATTHKGSHIQISHMVLVKGR